MLTWQLAKIKNLFSVCNIFVANAFLQLYNEKRFHKTISFHLLEVTFMLIKQEIEKANADAKLETQGEWDMMKFIKLAGIITATALLVNTTIADAATWT